MMRVSKKKIKHVAYLTVKVIVLGIFLVCIAFPFYWIILTSLKPDESIFSIPLTYFTLHLTTANYEKLFSNSNFGVYILNSLIVSLFAALGSVLFALFGAYILSRFKFPGKNMVMMFFFITQMLPSFLGLTTLYKMLAAWGMIDFLPTLIILNCAWMIPYSVITMRGFLQSTPVSLEESAMIDGCGRVGALFRIVVPIILPGVAATYIFCFVQSWNDLFSPILYMNSETNYTIPVALNAMVLANGIRWDELSAGTVIAIVPTIIMFAFAQKYVASGLLSGALKE
jgi:multiple sugar transport system permease protein